MGSQASSSSAERIRNIGIIAHVDAGKTTTTERMLFYSGKIRRPGDVDSGTTVTDFLEEERNRGITIQSACTTFGWDGRRINLIDTPGHVDFTVEVERSLRVLDGAVGILDAVAGVQAQTETVWKQAHAHAIPRIAFVNKMDRDGASLEHTVQSMRERIPGLQPLVTQLPTQSLDAVVDLVGMQLVEWCDSGGEDCVSRALTPADADPSAVVAAREALLEALAEIDDPFCEEFFEADDATSIPAESVRAAIRRATLALRAVPVLCGSSLKNRGVQPLLDAVCAYLPSPEDKPPKELVRRDAAGGSANEPTGLKLDQGAGGPLYGLAFKVTHDPHRGLLSFVRVYSGVLNAGDMVKVVSPATGQETARERASRILQIDGEDETEVKALGAGDIAAVVGLRSACSGDTLSSGKKSARKGAGQGEVFLPHSDYMEPVFYCAIEVETVTDQKALDAALQQIAKEDPSLVVEEDEETGQTLIKGMGELHLEIVHRRIVSDFGIGAELGRMRVSYREALGSSAECTDNFSHTVQGRQSAAAVSVMLEPLAEGEGGGEGASFGGVVVEVDSGVEQALLDGMSTNVAQRHLAEAKEGVEFSLQGGQLLGYPVVGARAVVTNLDVSHTTQSATTRAAAARATVECMRQIDVLLLEPVVKVDVLVPTSNVGGVLSDLTSRRRGTVVEVSHVEQAGVDTSAVEAEVPLNEMVGYATALRASTQGNGTFEMRFKEYRHVGKDIQEKYVEDPSLL